MCVVCVCLFKQVNFLMVVEVQLFSLNYPIFTNRSRLPLKLRNKNKQSSSPIHRHFSPMLYHESTPY